MDRTSERSQDRDAARQNRRLKIRGMATEILRQGSSLMTMAEAMAEADRRLDLAECHAVANDPRGRAITARR